VWIHKTEDTPLADRKTVLERMQRRLQTDDAFAWATDFFDTVGRARQEQHMLEVRLINRTIENEIVQRYRGASRRIIFLDYDGTLVPFSKYPEMAVPGQSVLERLRRLVEDPRNTLVVVSGRNRQFLDQWLGNLPIGLAAEHGAFIRMPQGPWISDVDADLAWKQQVLSVLQRYTDRCTGAFIEEKTFSLVWHYRNADPGVALLQSQQLKGELQALVSRDGRLQIMEGHKVIEVKRSGYDKGTVAARLLGQASYDFILAIGDDKTDEDLFRVLPDQALTVKIGMTASLAKFHLKDQQGVIKLMDRLLEAER
jgi:trehalose 6-phosphate synthase/phosphatase